MRGASVRWRISRAGGNGVRAAACLADSRTLRCRAGSRSSSINRDRPDDQFQPYGATVGHGLEWSRLLLHLEASLADPPDWLLPAAEALFDRAVADGWAVDGADGFVYTTDWDGTSGGP